MCGVSATITINTALSLATNITTVGLNSNALNTWSGAGQVVIGSNVGSGYYLSEDGPAGGFTDSAIGQVLPDQWVTSSVIGAAAGGITGGSSTPDNSTCPVLANANAAGVGGDYNTTQSRIAVPLSPCSGSVRSPGI